MSTAYTQPVFVTGGRVRGTITSDGTVCVYLGIPYAAAPAGDQRWRDLRPAAPWDDVRTCDRFGPSPIQQPQKPFLFWTREFIIRDTGYDEDCMTANVWAFNDGRKGKPVLVYFHGGGYNTGGSSCEIYDGEQMARRGIVFVSFNHRVGVSSLYTSPELDHEMPDGHSGNYMLRDSIFFLRWVKNNIAAFGGDPDNVTLMGQSSGAGEINALTVSLPARGLFKRAIALSLNNLKPAGHAEEWRSLQEEQEMWQGIYPGKTLEDMRKMPAENMIIRYPKPARPCIDGGMLDVTYREGLDQGRTSTVGLMLGAVAGDIRIVNTCYGIFVGNGNTMTHEQMIEKLHAFFGKHYEEADALYHFDREDIPALLEEVDTDLLLGGMLAVARKRRIHGGGETYVYYFNHLMPGSEQFGVFHSSEVPYMLDNLTHDRDGLWQEADRTFASRLADMIAAYTSSGCPDSEWKPTESTSYEYLSAQEYVSRKMTPEKYDFWMRVFD